MPNVIKCNKKDFWKKKGSIRKRCFFPFASSPSVYCNDQPNALDTAVRRCSYTLTLPVLNDSGRMNHGAEMDGAFKIISLPTIAPSAFVQECLLTFYFTPRVSFVVLHQGVAKKHKSLITVLLQTHSEVKG